MKKITIFVLCVFLTGCVSYAPTKPEGYIGEISFIKDSKKYHDTGKADMFYLEKINDKEIYHSRTYAYERSYGQGNYLYSIDMEHEVPAQAAKFTIVGRTVYAMPIRAIAGTVYEVRTDVEFVPEPNHKYLVKGNLSEESSEIWIESATTPGLIIDKFKIDGSTSLGILSK